MINRFALSGAQGCVQLLLCFLLRLNSSHPLHNTCILFIGHLVSIVTDCFQCMWTECLTDIMYTIDNCDSSLTDRGFHDHTSLWPLVDVADLDYSAAILQSHCGAVAN